LEDRLGSDSPPCGADFAKQNCEEKLAIIMHLSSRANANASLADQFAAMALRKGKPTEANILAMQSVRVEFLACREEWQHVKDRLRQHRAEHGC
jgi:hypothetical protein